MAARGASPHDDARARRRPGGARRIPEPVTRALAIALVLVVATACGGAEERAEPPPTLPATALPELESHERTLDAGALAEDAFEPGPLAELVDGALLGGREREFSGRTRTFDHVVARTLVFSDADGAAAYLGWFREHADELLGPVERAALAPPGEEGVAFTLVRCGTCKKELAALLAGWRRGTTVFTLLASGSGANERRFARLVHELDDAVGLSR